MIRWTRLALGATVAVGALLMIDWRGLAPLLAEAFSKAVSLPALGVAVTGQTAALATCAVALGVLDARIPTGAAAASRWVRDAVGAAPVGLPGLGEAAGVRVLSLAGVAATAAAAATVADVLAETIAQAVYALAALALAPSSLRVAPPAVHAPVVAVAVGGLAAVTAAAAAVRWAPASWRTAAVAVATEAKRRLRSPRFAACLALHGAAWVMGGVQVFLLARVLGAPVNLLQGLSLEGLIFALRAAFFFVPAGAGVQEVGVAAVGAWYGLAPMDTAALALLLRLRDVVVLAPALPIWLGLELRADGRRRVSTAAAVREARPCA